MSFGVTHRPNKTGEPKMLIRLRVVPESLDALSKSFQSRGPVADYDEAELDRIAFELESGALVRFYRGGDPQGRVVAARRTFDGGLWIKIRLASRAADAWKLLRNGAINTIEIQPLAHGVDLFLKSVAATYPAEVA
jgi:hypothetical protein